MAWKNNVVERNNHCPDIDTSAEGMKSKLQREIEALRAGTPNNIDHREVVAPRELTPDETSRLRVQLRSKLNITNPSQEEDASDLLDYAIGMVSDIGQTVGYMMNELLFMEMDVFTSDVADSFGQCLAAFLIDIGGGVTTLTLAQRRGGTGQKTGMFDIDGNIIACTNNAGEQDNQYPEMDTSAAGMKSKLQREMEALRAAGKQQDLKRQMFDDDGNVIAYIDNNNGEQDRHNRSMDLSSGGMILKKHKEIEALKDRSNSTRALNVKQKIYDEDGNLVKQWGGFKEHAEERKQLAKSMPIGSSAEGSKLKQAQEIANLRASTSTNAYMSQMYDSDGHIIKVNNNDGERDNQYPDMDTSATGMKLKLLREMNAMRNGVAIQQTTDYKQTAVPRELTPDEISKLRVMLKSKLNVTDSNEQDADDLCDYAIDMIEESKTVGNMVDEVSILLLCCFDSHPIKPPSHLFTFCPIKQTAFVHGNGSVHIGGSRQLWPVLVNISPWIKWRYYTCQAKQGHV